jgi:hypothetical protein
VPRTPFRRCFRRPGTKAGMYSEVRWSGSTVRSSSHQSTATTTSSSSPRWCRSTGRGSSTTLVVGQGQLHFGEEVARPALGHQERTSFAGRLQVRSCWHRGGAPLRPEGRCPAPPRPDPRRRVPGARSPPPGRRPATARPSARPPGAIRARRRPLLRAPPPSPPPPAPPQSRRRPRRTFPPPRRGRRRPECPRSGPLPGGAPYGGRPAPGPPPVGWPRCPRRDRYRPARGPPP